MLTGKKRIISLILTGILIFTSAFSLAGCNSGGGSSQASSSTPDETGNRTDNAYGLPSSLENGAILHCFSWSFNTIKESMADIAAAGFSAVQTSPINECIVGGDGGMQLFGDGKWYYHYQPTDWKIGNYQLGTRDEFKEMCSVAEEYGIKVIVDVVPNHTTGDRAKVSQNLIDAVGGADKLYHKNSGTNITNYGDRLQVTTRDLTGLSDVNTENPAFQDYYIKFVNDAIACGADGFRYDTAKHIGLPGDPKEDDGFENNFWERVTKDINSADKMFIYGEVLQGDNDRILDYMEAIGRTTSSSYGGAVRAAVENGYMPIGTISDYRLGGKATNTPKVVTWIESHDEYISYGTSQSLLQGNLMKAYAIIASRQGGTPLFFDRPYEYSTVNIWGTINHIGASGSYDYKSPIITAVNRFRNAMAGMDEKLSNPQEDTKKSIMIERGKKGLVLVNTGGDFDLNAPTALDSGTYVNRVDGKSTFTVKDGRITGKVKDGAIIVLYNYGYFDIEKMPEVKVDLIDSVYVYDSIDVTLRVSGAKSGKYSVNGEEPKEYKDGDKITIKPKSDTEMTSSLKLTALSESGKQSMMTFYYVKKQTIKKGDKVTFKAPASWTPPIYAYVYDESTMPAKQNSQWPGEEIKDEGSGIFSYTFTEDWNTAHIIFSDGENQVPAAMEPGFEAENGKQYTVNG